MLASQPFSLDGATWIVADARVDARAQLVADLKAAGREASTGRPDVELILHSWHAWGEGCVDRLLGDFAFAIWDSGRRRLFCARDHFGIKPLFHSHRGDLVVFSSSLACVRRHPAVSATLDDLAIADFPVCGHQLDRAATSFAGHPAPSARTPGDVDGRGNDAAPLLDAAHRQKGLICGECRKTAVDIYDINLELLEYIICLKSNESADTFSNLIRRRAISFMESHLKYHISDFKGLSSIKLFNER